MTEFPAGFLWGAATEDSGHFLGRVAKPNALPT
jgi:hypothetical protein